MGLGSRRIYICMHTYIYNMRTSVYVMYTKTHRHAEGYAGFRGVQWVKSLGEIPTP